MHRLILILPLLLQFIFGSWVTAQQAGERNEIPVKWTKHIVVDSSRTAINSAQAADFDQDGDIDIIAAYNGSVFVHLAPDWRPLEVYRFKPGRSKNKPRGATIHSTLMDCDQDGDLDFVGSNQTLFWLECPDQITKAPWIYRTIDDEILGTHCVLVGDVNQDGIDDLIANSFQDASKTKIPNSIVWFDCTLKTRLDNGWHRHVFANRDAPGGSHYMGIGDLNADGRPDITCAAKGIPFAQGNWFAWWEQPAKASEAWKKHILAIDQIGATNILPAQINNDGQLDIVATRGHGQGILWFEAPEFKPIDIDSKIEGPHTLVVADLDGNESIDIAVCGRGDNGTCAWYRNDGSGQFSKFTIDRAQGSYDLRAVDMDRDGDLDLLCAGHQTKNLVWYENHGSK